jgi:hypothetical protein
MTEPDVALTDYGLTLECGLFLALLWRAPIRRPELRPWLLTFFGSLAVASLLGGTVHGFFLDRQPAEKWLWSATLLAIGVNALSIWALAAHLLLARHAAYWFTTAAAVLFVLYAAVVLFLKEQFWVAIVDYAPAGLFLLAALWWTYRQTGNRGAVLGVWAVGISLFAALVQQLRVALHPVYFNHNALYHVLQAFALFLGFLASWRLVEGAGDRMAVPVASEREEASAAAKPLI